MSHFSGTTTITLYATKVKARVELNFNKYNYNYFLHHTRNLFFEECELRGPLQTTSRTLEDHYRLAQPLAH